MFKKYFHIIFATLIKLCFILYFFVYKLTQKDVFAIISLLVIWLATFLYITYFLKYKEIRMIGVNYRGKEGIPAFLLLILFFIIINILVILRILYWFDYL